MVQSGTARCVFQSPCPTHRTASRMWVARGGHHSPCRQARPNSERRTPIVAAAVSRPAGSISHHRCARFRTQRLTPADPCRGSRGQMLSRHHEREVMGKLEGKVAGLTGGATGIGLDAAKRFIEEGAFVFIFGRRQEALDAALADLGRNARAVKGSVCDLADLDRLYGAVKAERGTLDIVFANAGAGSQLKLGEITAEHIDETFDINSKGTIFTGQKALPVMGEGGSIILTGSSAGTTGAPAFTAYSASKAAVRNLARTWAEDL